MSKAHRGVAQVVERLVRDQEAGGSSPLTPTRTDTAVDKIYRLPYRFLYVENLLLTCTI
jgi:hypothetical protein